MTFEKRCLKSDEYIEEFRKRLKELNVETYPYGYEKNLSLEIRKKLIEHTDPTAKTFRYKADYRSFKLFPVSIKPFLLEIKNSEAIEMDSFLINMEDSKRGPEKVALAISNFRIAWIENLNHDNCFRRIKKNEYLEYNHRRILIFWKKENYKDYMNSLCGDPDADNYEKWFPYEEDWTINADGIEWIAPRKMPDEKYTVWKFRKENVGPSASGTPYRYVKTSLFEPLEKFISNLGQQEFGF